MNPIKSRLAANIRIAREEKNLSRPQLAALMECHVNTIYKYETTEREVPSDQLEQLAGILRGGNWLWFYNNDPAVQMARGNTEAEAVATTPEVIARMLEEARQAWKQEIIAELKQHGGDLGLTKCEPLEACSSDELVNLLIERATPQAQEMMSQQKAS